MKALVKKSPEPGLWLENVPTPQISINDVLIKIHKTSICGTDLHIFNWDAWAQKTIKPPAAKGISSAGAAGIASPAEGTSVRTRRASASIATAHSPNI
jgi:threonine dehydrogenase-like Zn-dependent dehydrogenase